MAELGKCLLFYLKYPAEMERLYEADKPEIDGISNPDEILEKIKTSAMPPDGKQASSFKACAPGHRGSFSQNRPHRADKGRCKSRGRFHSGLGRKRTPKEIFKLGLT